MKKLMIAAAAAAMIGSVWAAAGDPVVYQATYNLKTTVGKAAKNGETVNLGKSAAGEFWYENGTVANVYFSYDAVTRTVTNIIDKTNFTMKNVGGTMVPVLTAAGQKDATVVATLQALEATYNKKSLNKWCLTFKGNPVCYRVAGSIKISGYFVDDECLSGFTPTVADAFGAATLAKSTKAEFFAEDTAAAGALALNAMTLSKKNDLADPVDVLDNTKGERVITWLAIAGHGTYGKVYDDTDATHKREGFTAFSGNAVGTADMPECLSCCAVDVPVVAWDCCAVAATDTAVFGTFSYKYNDKGTKDLY